MYFEPALSFSFLIETALINSFVILVTNVNDSFFWIQNYHDRYITENYHKFDWGKGQKKSLIFHSFLCQTKVYLLLPIDI